jgi:hypothetical protein
VRATPNRCDEYLAAPGAQRLADESLVLAALIARGGVEVIDAAIDGLEQRRARFGVVADSVPADESHATEPNRGQRLRYIA